MTGASQGSWRRSGTALIVSIACTLTAFCIQLLLESYAGSITPPFLAFFPAIVVAALVSGSAAGWLTFLLSSALAIRFLLAAQHAPDIDMPRVLILALFLCSGTLIVLVAGAYRRSLDRAEQARLALASSEAQLRLAHEAANIGTWEYVIAEGRVIWSPEMFALYDLDPSMPAPTLAEWRSRVQVEGSSEDQYNLRRDLRMSGETLDRELCILTFEGRSRWLIGRSVAVGDPGEPPTRFIGVNIDITAQKASEERERLLAHELDHRAKNMLAMVQSVVQLTREERIPQFREAVIGRIQSLARSHSLLAASRWEGADLMHLIRDELEPFMSGEHAEIKASGPRIRLQPAAAQTLALLIHELATNAVKYGALSTESGQLAVRWHVTEGRSGDLLLDWTESGGPRVRIPDQRGFGSRLIVSSVERQLRGSVNMNWLSTGLHCEVKIPAAHLIHIHDGGPTDTPPPVVNMPPEESAGNRTHRVLVVENETLIALQMEQALALAQHVMIGPVTRLSEIPEALVNSMVDCAILDINLGGERSFAIADLLVSRRIPFIFCTGFAAPSILPDRFKDVPVIIKPFSAGTLLTRIDRIMRKQPAGYSATGTVALQAE